MAFFMRELTPVERFESTLRDKHAARRKLAARLSLVETVVGEKRAAAERLAGAGPTDAKLGRAEASCAPPRSAPRLCEPNWWNSTSRSPQPNVHWLTPKRNATATWRRIRLRRWLRQSSRPHRDLVPVPPGSWTPSQKARRQCWRRP